jgi:hypothetical protein
VAHTLVTKFHCALSIYLVQKSLARLPVFRWDYLMEMLVELHEFGKSQHEMGNANLLDVYHHICGEMLLSEPSIPGTEKHRSADEITNEVSQYVSCVHSRFPDLVTHYQSA